MPGRVNGFSLAYTATGAVVLWSGIRGWSISETFKNLLSGKTPSASTETISTTAADTAPAGTSGGGAATAAGGNPGTAAEKANQATGKLMAAAYGWSTGTEWTALNNVVMAESGWNNLAQNPTSTAYGIFQFLDTTWASTGYAKSSNPVTQIAAGLKYVKQRYGDPVKAWQFHQANGYY